MAKQINETAEKRRLAEQSEGKAGWNFWGPYLSDRQWGTVREDYSDGGDCWNYFPHDHARSRAYRWGEDGLLGISDEKARLCFAVALWNGRDPILKERLFGLTGPEGNHGEDVKELYYHLDATPSHSYLKALYKYPQAEFPYGALVHGNRHRGKHEGEFELLDTGVFDDGRYFDVFVEYAKASEDDILIRITVANRGPAPARLALLPTLWFRNTWSWGARHEGNTAKPAIRRGGPGVVTEHEALDPYAFAVEAPEGTDGRWLFTDNETNFQRLYGQPNKTPHVKDAFDRFVVHGDDAAVNPEGVGTKAAVLLPAIIPAGGEFTVRARLCAKARMPKAAFGAAFDKLFAQRIAEADEFHESLTAGRGTPDEKAVLRQGHAGLVWTKQFYHYFVREWIEGDPGHPPPPAGRRRGRNREWQHFNCADVLSMPDKWEYPWFAAWDLAFHMIPFAKIDPDFAKGQLDLLTREWFMHPNGQIPAYEFAFGDVNPPVHAWATWRVYKMTGPRGARDVRFLERVFHKLLMNFTWWVNRKDPNGNNVFGGGFLGLDNIGVFDRNQPLPTGGHLEQSDGTAWMAFYSGTMLSMALELAQFNSVYEDIATKFFEHFLSIADAMNFIGGNGLWDEEDGFYYDKIQLDGGGSVPLKTRSLVGILPVIAVEVLDECQLEKLPNFSRRMQWFLANTHGLEKTISLLGERQAACGALRLLAIPSRDRLARMLRYVFDEDEFLSDYGIRGLSRAHSDPPYRLRVGGQQYEVRYTPGESDTWLFGGNSNWRGPIWFPINFLIVESLERYHHFYGDDFKVEFPTRSGNWVTLGEASALLAERLAAIFLRDGEGHRPAHDGHPLYAQDPAWRDLILFYEYFHGDSGRGVGASHQTGWTALVTTLLRGIIQKRDG
ncbi:MAG: glucosidase [Candidatus Sumerlaeia bacterium]|nr:glucosidase [Candidatus Sumerlaeia bacterium]